MSILEPALLPPVCYRPRNPPKKTVPRSDVDRRQGWTAPNDISHLLGDHDHRGIDVGTDEIRHHRRIDDSQPVDAAQFAFRIDHRIRIAVDTHLAGAERVMCGGADLAHMRIDLGITLGGWAG